jgi:AAA ATPase domain
LARNENPFKPGAGHMPPYLAGRDAEQRRFEEILNQTVITENLVLTGLRGVGKTVLLETLRPIARNKGWLWTGTDMSESAGISEERLAMRLITDISVITSPILHTTTLKHGVGFRQDSESVDRPVDFHHLISVYNSAPGLVVDKLRNLLIGLWGALDGLVNGVVFAYDEAQILSDHSKNGEFPLSMLLELFQSIQKQNIPFLLVLTGLPTLFPRLVEARTYSERMFHVMFLSQLSPEQSRDAITRPTESDETLLKFSEHSVQSIIQLSGGYPYFIQFICKEVYDVWLSKLGAEEPPSVPEQAIVSKLDNDFFAARWDKATDRERDLLTVISRLPNADGEFSVNDIVVAAGRELEKPFSASQTNQMLGRLTAKGLIYKNRHGRYLFAVPLMSKFIKRQSAGEPNLFDSAP